MSFFVLADDFNMEISESGSVLNYYNEYFVVNVDGNFTITNNYNIPIYGINIPFNPSTLSILDLSNRGYIVGNSIRIPSLEPGDSVQFPYSIIGIATEDPFNDIYGGRQTAFRDIIENVSIKAYSDMVIAFKKEELGMRDSGRILEVRVTNPTALEYVVNNMRIIKTRDENVNDEMYHIDIEDKSVIYGFEEWSQLIIDDNTGLKEDDVYWFYVDLSPQNFNISYNESIDLNIFTEADLDKLPEDQESADGSQPSTEFIPQIKVFVRKLVSPTRIFPGDFMNITLIVTNLEQQSLEC